MKRRILESIGFVGVLAALCLGVALYYMAGVDPELEARNAALSGELTRLESQAEQQRMTISALKVEVERLRAGDDERVHRARANLGLISANERIYQFVDSKKTKAGGDAQGASAEKRPQ